MEKIRKNYTKYNKWEYVSDIKMLGLYISRGYGDMVFEAVRQELQELSNKLKFKFSEVLRFDTVNGLHKVATNVLSKSKGNNKANEHEGLEDGRE